jgi:DNA-binding MarR family transcriptional regulator
MKRDGGHIFRLNLRLSTETLGAASPAIEALGLDAKEFFVLDALEDQAYPAELARHLSMAKPTMTLYLKSLQQKGLINRAIDPSDLRRHRLELTDQGRSILSRSRSVLADCYTERLSRLNSQEQNEFAKLLEKLCS